MRVLLIVVCLLVSGCVTRFKEPLRLVFEFRAPKVLHFDPLTKFDLSTDQSASGTRLRFTERAEDGDYAIFRSSFLVFEHEHRRALIVSFVDERPSQVFVLPLPRKPQVTGWIGWVRPSYSDDSSAVWAFMHGEKKRGLTSTPPDSFELRYRVEER